MDGNNRDFFVDITGDKTHTRYEGVFVVKMVLTRKEKFQSDEKRRIYLGISGNQALPDVIKEAYILAELQVRVVSAPQWWKITNNGEDIVDDNVLESIYNKFNEAEKEYLEEQAKAFEADLKELATDPEPQTEG